MASKEISTPAPTADAIAPQRDHEKADAIIQGDNDVDDLQKPIKESETPGVKKVERFSHVLYHSGKSGRVLLYILAISIGLTMFGYALDQGKHSQQNIST